MTRGGKREGSGNKPDVPLKSDDERRDIRKTYRFSNKEYDLIKKAVKASGIKESKIVREGALKEARHLRRRSNKKDEAHSKGGSKMLLVQTFVNGFKVREKKIPDDGLEYYVYLAEVVKTYGAETSTTCTAL